MTTISNIRMPILVDVHAADGRWNITSKWTDELAEKVVQFLTTNSFAFYTTGAAPTVESARKLVQSARERAELGIPFTRFPVLDAQGEVIGEFAIGFDDDPTKLQLAGRGVALIQNKGVGREILQWCLHTYIPELYRKGVRLPVLKENEDDILWNDKTVMGWRDLKEVNVVATVHPEYTHCVNLLEKSGFQKTQDIVKENFQGVRDGRRSVYEFSLNNVLA